MTALHDLAESAGRFTGLQAEHEEFRRSVRPFLESAAPEAEVRRLMATESGYDPAVWRRLADQLGLQGLIVPEQYGGSGFTFLELGVVLEELGRTLACVPYFSTVVLGAVTLLQAGDESAAADYLPGIAAGETIATLAVTEDDGRWQPDSVRMSARQDGDSWRVSGTKSFVIDGQSADLLIVAARTAAGVSLFAVDGTADGLTRTPLTTLDQTRKQAELRFEDTPARLIGSDGEGWPVIEAVLDRAAVALAAEQVGGAQRCLEMAVDYAKVRTQFGRVIGSFQAIKHKCADVLLGVESARSALYFALQAVTENAPELPAVASLVKAYCSETYSTAASENIQVHGGIGFTWEHPAHLYFKRATSSALLFGDSSEHRAAFTQRIGV